jgi:hypothetical protein
MIALFVKMINAIANGAAQRCPSNNIIRTAPAAAGEGQVDNTAIITTCVPSYG